MVFWVSALVPVVCFGETVGNLALKKKARQSSTGYGGDPQRAVDGNTDGNYGANSVTHTDNQKEAWWEVDLGRVQDIREIKLWNRTDCCSERLSDFVVLVSEQPFRSNTLDDSLNNSSVWNYSIDGVAQRETSVPVGVPGRYVRIQLRGSNWLSLAEVQVLGAMQRGGYGSGATVREPVQQSKGNLALKKKARQSSTGYGGDPQRAVDGNTDGNYSANSVTHTDNQKEAWWEVDLGRAQSIREIKIWNRTDCCSERLSDFVVLVSEQPFRSSSLDDALNDSSVWSYPVDGVAQRETSVPVDVSGRYVRIQLRGSNWLSLAEVKVLGAH